MWPCRLLLLLLMALRRNLVIDVLRRERLEMVTLSTRRRLSLRGRLLLLNHRPVHHHLLVLRTRHVAHLAAILPQSSGGMLLLVLHLLLLISTRLRRGLLCVMLINFKLVVAHSVVDKASLVPSLISLASSCHLTGLYELMLLHVMTGRRTIQMLSCSSTSSLMTILICTHISLVHLLLLLLHLMLLLRMVIVLRQVLGRSVVCTFGA